MTDSAKIMPTPAGPLVVAIVYDGLCMLEFGIVAEIFGLPRPEMGSDWYRFASCAVEPGPLRAQGGVVVQAVADAGLIDAADLIIVPGWRGVDEAVPEALCEMLRAAYARGARLASICSGVVVLAQAGLLDHTIVATHWRYANAMRRRFPGLQVDEASLYRTHGRVFTSAGSAAGIDLLLEIVRQDFGPGAANSVARRMVVPAHRNGGQAQFLERPVPVREQAAIAPLLDLIRQAPGERWPLSRMASECRMSLRSFARRFAEATGMSPGAWLLMVRIEMARGLLERGMLSLDEVAQACGFGTLDTLRHHFRKSVGISPSAYRAQSSR